MSVAPQISLQLRTFANDRVPLQPLFDLAIAADRAGIDRLVVSDHVAFGEALDAYGDPKVGGIEGGRQPTGPDGSWLEPVTVLSVLAGLTHRVRLGTNILQVALRRPAVLAKTLATLDVVSAGRLDLGVGVGWQQAEYDVAGLDFDRRGRLLDESLEIMQLLWREQSASFASDELSFAGIHQMPKPVQQGGVPVWVSGTVNARSMSRLARFGSGWIPWGPDALDAAGGIRRMRRAVEDLARDSADLGVVGTLPVVRDPSGEARLDATMRGVGELVSAGVTDFRAHLAVPEDPEAAATFLADVVERFRAATR